MWGSRDFLKIFESDFDKKGYHDFDFLREVVLLIEVT